MKYLSQTLARRTFAAALAFTLGGAMAEAHPGHDLQDASATHILTSPYHLAVLALSGAALRRAISALIGSGQTPAATLASRTRPRKPMRHACRVTPIHSSSNIARARAT